MNKHLLRWVKGAASLSAAALTAVALQFPSVAVADTAPADTATPTTVSADALPTVQIDGVAWTQLIIGNTVYVGGSFATARPAGAAAGVNTTPRANLLAYDITTGNLISSWAPTTNGDVLTITASPDKSRIYIGGSFTNVNGVIRNRIAALNPATGALITTFNPKSDATVRAIAASSSTVYFGGLTTAVNGVARNRLAAVQASDGALLSWAPDAQGGPVRAMALSTDGSKLLVGGSFTTVNGSANPGYGLAAIDPATGASLPWTANNLVRNGGASSGITSIVSDGADNVYVTGFTFGPGGNLEGTVRMSWSTGAVVWVEDCHGDTYQAYPMGDVVYAVSHAHYCGNVPGGFQQTNPWTFHFGTAFTQAVKGVLTADPLGYFNWAGNPAPELLKWIPSMTTGTYTGQGQAGWTVTGNGTYVVYGGEFPRAGGTAQQGLVRFAVKNVAPNKVGPEFSGSKFNPSVVSLRAGTVRIAWQANWDRDNEQLTYSVIRNGITATPISTTTAASSEWSRPMMGFVDTGLTPGSTVRYRVFAKDPFGNEVRSETISVVVSSDGTVSPYGQDVVADGAGTYWRLGEAGGTTAYDWAGFNDGVVSTGVTRGAEGAISGDTNTASTFDGSSAGTVASTTAITGPDTFTTEAWFKTGTTSGGKIIGFGGSQSGLSGSYDRMVYMTNAGKLVFGVYPNAVRTVSSAKTYNDNQWHHVVASLGANGMALYVDGTKVGSRADTVNGQSYSGYWRVGGDNIGGWPDQPASSYFAGSIDDVAIYPTALSSTQVRKHYTDSGRTIAGGVAPADAYGASVYNAEPDLYWRVGESSGTTAADSSATQAPGIYSGGVSFGTDGAVGGSNTAITLNGVDGAVSSQSSYNNPTTYSEELWFNTTTNQGGKLIGFGSSQIGTSGGYDRHVYMFNDGRIRFGVWTGFTNVIDSSLAYNDGRWHHLVATQSGEGMKLYIDNQLIGTNGQTAAQDYTGYWKVGGDNTWGGNSSNYFAGSIDEVAVYSRALSATEVKDHYAKGGGTVPNSAPAAAFTTTVDHLDVSVDGSGSTDSDGTVASYGWDFGDGVTATGATAQHSYAAAGDYQVTLTVTDDKGATNQLVKTVTAVAPPANVAPTAAFTSSVSKLAVAFDATGSTDTDGTVASYAWTFGDGSTGTGKTVSHTYAAAGDYSVTLTVTDDKGATTDLVKSVSAVANVKPTASFTTSVADLAVGVNAAGSTDSDGTVASYAWNFGDGTTGTGVTASRTYAAAGSYQVTLTVTDSDGATDTTVKTVTVTAPVGPVAQDSFARTVANGWGTADRGGVWTRTGTSSLFSVGNGVGTMKLATAGSSPTMTLGSVSETATDVTVKVALDKVANGGGEYVSVAGRTVGTSSYRAKLKIASTGATTLILVKVVGSTETTLVQTNLGSAMSYTAGTQLQFRVQVSGTAPTTVRAKVWKAASTEPTAWTLTTTDSTAGLQAAGGVGLVSYLSASSTNTPVTVTFSNLLVQKP